MAGHREISASPTDLGTSRSRGTAAIADMVKYAIAGIARDLVVYMLLQAGADGAGDAGLY
jgi:hypothetical protein